MARPIDDPTVRIDDAPLPDVTRESRITGNQRRVVQPRTVGAGVPADSGYAPALNWHAVLASVCVGVALSAMLVILGAATGLVAGDQNSSTSDAVGILGAIGAWAVIAVILSSFVGGFVGGRLTRWMDRLSIAGNTLVSWGLATLLSILLLCVVAIAFSSATTSVAASSTAAEVASGGTADTAADAAANANADKSTTTTAKTAPNSTTADEAANNTADALGGAGWALTAAMLLSLLASGAGWFLGSRRRLTSIEREDDMPATV